MLTLIQNAYLQAFQEEFESRKSTLNTLQQTANPEDPAVLQQLNTLNDLWTKVDNMSHTRENQLKDNLNTVSVLTYNQHGMDSYCCIAFQ